MKTTRLIGWKWKCSNACSGPVLIGRGLDQEKNEEFLNGCSTNFEAAFILYIFECVVKNNILNHFGDDEVGGTPVPMPNTAVKPYVAEDT